MEPLSREGHRILHLFGDLLSYPQRGLAAAARECESQLAPSDPDAARRVAAFRAFAEGATAARLEEVYTSAFDLNAAWHPYVGYQLFGETYKRSAFLLGLQERYRAESFHFAGELADHLAVLLRFLSACDDRTLVEEVVGDALIPALERMLGRAHDGSEAAPNAYRNVLEALSLALRPQVAPSESGNRSQ